MGVWLFEVVERPDQRRLDSVFAGRYEGLVNLEHRFGAGLESTEVVAAVGFHGDAPGETIDRVQVINRGRGGFCCDLELIVLTIPRSTEWRGI